MSTSAPDNAGGREKSFAFPQWVPFIFPVPLTNVTAAGRITGMDKTSPGEVPFEKSRPAHTGRKRAVLFLAVTIEEKDEAAALPEPRYLPSHPQVAAHAQDMLGNLTKASADLGWRVLKVEAVPPHDLQLHSHAHETPMGSRHIHLHRHESDVTDSPVTAVPAEAGAEVNLRAPDPGTTASRSAEVLEKAVPALSRAYHPQRPGHVPAPLETAQLTMGLAILADAARRMREHDKKDRGLL